MTRPRDEPCNPKRELSRDHNGGLDGPAFEDGAQQRLSGTEAQAPHAASGTATADCGSAAALDGTVRHELGASGMRTPDGQQREAPRPVLGVRPRDEIDEADETETALAALRLAIRFGTEAQKINARTRLDALIAAKDAEIARLREDAERLDWMEGAVPSGEFRRACEGIANATNWKGTVREIVDAARSPNRGTPE